jgi:CRISPR-associated endonuclease/helicase Cas3
MDFETFFACATVDAQTGAGLNPREWQRELADAQQCRNRLIRIPTGFGKTLGVLLAWFWRAVESNAEGWPGRLVICLPMRVLVEQTRDEVGKVLRALGVLWDERSNHDGKVGLHVLMGGVDRDSDWYLYPEQFAVLISTQDMALSTVLNRGYSVPRARWPVEFGLLNQDTLWVMDEVQLMDVGMATSIQLQAFRDDYQARGRSLRQCTTWWMSATLRPEWLEKSPDTQALTADLPETRIPPNQRGGHLWDDVAKPCRLEQIKDEKALAKLVTKEHADAGLGLNGPTVVVVNTVERATTLFEVLRKDKGIRNASVDLELVHSRFRPFERARWPIGLIEGPKPAVKTAKKKKIPSLKSGGLIACAQRRTTAVMVGIDTPGGRGERRAADW